MSLLALILGIFIKLNEFLVTLISHSLQHKNSASFPEELDSYEINFLTHLDFLINSTAIACERSTI